MPQLSPMCALLLSAGLVGGSDGFYTAEVRELLPDLLLISVCS